MDYNWLFRLVVQLVVRLVCDLSGELNLASSSEAIARSQKTSAEF